MVGNPIYPRLLVAPRGSFFLFGVRGSGKSTWARAELGTAHAIDLLDEALHHDLLLEPGRFAAELGDLPRGSWVVVDEVQRIPGLLNEVHRLIETRGLRFALLGSSARKLRAAGTNLLAGRATWRTMFPLLPEELGRDFALDPILQHGSIPLVWAAPDRRAALESYVQLYLREEIRAEALVRNLPGFVRFLPIAALCHAQAINVSGIARDAGTARTTVEGYLEILEDTLLATRLHGYEARLRVRERKHPKLYWVDPGLVRAVKRQLGPLALEERGALFEGWIFTLLRAYAQHAALYDDVHFWSPPSGASMEVDFLLRRGREWLAIEAKAGARFDTAMAAGLRAIADLPHLVRRIVVFNGPRAMTTPDGIEAWPVRRFLDALAGGTLWP